MTDLPASWQTDPTGRHDHRYWDGTAWTENVADAGIASIDPYEPAAAPESTTASGWGSPGEPTETTADEAEPTEVAPAPSGWASAPTAIVPGVSGDAPTEISQPAVPPTGPSSLADRPAPTPPTEPTPSPSDGAGGGDARRNLLIGAAILLVVAVVAFLAISGDDDDASTDVVADRIVASLNESQPGISDKDASCMADFIVDEVGADRLQDVDWDSDTPPSGDLGNDVTDAYAEAVSKCDVDLSDEGGGSDTTDPGSTDDSTGGLGDVGDIDAFKDLLAEQYEATLGLSSEQSRCLADAMGQAIKEGKLDQQDAFGDFFEYLDACDISLSELSGSTG